MRRRNFVGLLAAAMLAGILVAGCGGGSSSSTAATEGSNGSTKTVSETSGSGELSEAEKAVATNYEGTDGKLPVKPTKPPAEENLWIISCAQAVEGCKLPAEAVAEAAKKIGWEARVLDGKVEPAVYNSLIRQGVAANVNVIVLVGIDCSLTKASLEGAKAAGIEIVGIYAQDCDQGSSGGGKPLFDAEVEYANGGNFASWLSGPWAKSMVDYAIAKTEGDVKAILLREHDNGNANIIDEGIEAALKECGSDCEMHTVDFTAADLVDGGLQAKTQTALTQNPDVNVVFSGYDTAQVLGVAPGVEASGRANEVLSLGGEGLAPNIKLIEEEKGQNFAAGFPARWNGWAAVDELIRYLNGEEPVNEGIGLQSIDKEHNIPAETPYYDGNVEANGKPKQDYEANFLKLWGKG
jgi:ribose transport system substrate-binding protein